MKKITMKPGTMLNPVPAVLVSCAYEDRKNLITIAWTGIVNSEPPMTYISVRKSRFSHSLISKSGEFVINLVSEDKTKELDFCGVKSGRDLDKFNECGFTAIPSEMIGAPLVDEAIINLECVVKEVHEYQSHDMFVAEIVKVHAAEKLFDETGRLCLENAHMITFCHGEYYGIKKYPIGKFGYSIMKPKTSRRVNKEVIEKKRIKRNFYKKSR